MAGKRFFRVMLVALAAILSSGGLDPAKACRSALWLALLQAQHLGWMDLSDALLEMLRDVDRRRADLDRGEAA